MPAISLTHMSPIWKTIVALFLLVPFCVAAPSGEYEETHSESHDFAAGGKLQLRLSVGDVRITHGDKNEIRLRYTVKSRRESHVKDAKVDFEVRGNDARIDFRAPSGDNTHFEVELEVPQNTNLDVHEKVGDLTVENIDGDKDLELGVGDIHVELACSSYRLVNASASIGDVNGDDYGESKGWLGKSVRFHGDGKYELRARVSVGDITLEGKYPFAIPQVSCGFDRRGGHSAKAALKPAFQQPQERFVR